MKERQLKNPGKNSMPKPKITEKSKPINTLGMLMHKIEQEPLKRDEFSQIRQYLQDALLKKHISR
jgi:hypothetical protein